MAEENQAREQALCGQLDAQYGLRNMRREWIRRQTSFTAEELRSVICRTDLCVMSYGTLPWDVARAHAVPLGVTTLLQVDDVINVACADPRALTAKPCVFQATLTDGCHDIVAIDLDTPPSPRFAQVSSMPGAKLKLFPSARVRRGRVLLRQADYVVLGLPPANVWAGLYAREIAATRQAAGLPDHAANAQMSLGRVVESDDTNLSESVTAGEAVASLVWTGDSNDPNALPLNIGGIADPALLAAAEEAENGVVVSQAQQGSGSSQPQPQPQPQPPATSLQPPQPLPPPPPPPPEQQHPFQSASTANISGTPLLGSRVSNQQPGALTRSVPSPTARTGTGTTALVPNTLAEYGRIQSHDEHHASNDMIVRDDDVTLRSGGNTGGGDNIPESMDIPDVPDSDDDDWLALLGTQENNGQGMPRAPLDRLCDEDAKLVRAYCVRTHGAQGTVLDDGSAVRMVKLGHGMMQQLTGIGSGADVSPTNMEAEETDGNGDGDAEADADAQSNPSGRRDRSRSRARNAAVRGLCGFVRVIKQGCDSDGGGGGDGDGVIFDNTEEVGDGDAVIEEVSGVPRETASGEECDIKGWLRMFADNVEGRLVKHLMNR